MTGATLRAESPTAAASPLQTAPLRTKICGAVRAAEVRSLAAAGADLVGLWHGIPGGPADLSLSRLTALTAVAAEAGTTAVMVTFLGSADRIVEAVETAAVPWVQLHGYQSPAVVAALRARLPRTTLVKVLHLGPAGCLEQRFVPAYTRAGTDLFLLDHLGADGRVGSTGSSVPPARALAVADRLDVPFLLAGGLHPGSGPEVAEVLAHPGCAGVDVDTGARDATGRFDPGRVVALVALTAAVPRHVPATGLVAGIAAGAVVSAAVDQQTRPSLVTAMTVGAAVGAAVDSAVAEHADTAVSAMDVVLGTVVVAATAVATAPDGGAPDGAAPDGAAPAGVEPESDGPESAAPEVARVAAVAGVATGAPDAPSPERDRYVACAPSPGGPT